MLNDLFLSQGYGVASSSLNVLNNNCCTIISAEAAMMVKEHFIESYGPARFTIGWGGSGGAIQQYDIADAYPGILDGIIPGVSYPDPITHARPGDRLPAAQPYFASTGLTYSDAQKAAISGFGSYHVCTSWDLTFANRITATDSCDPAIPVAARWDPVTNPDGVKCSAAEQVVTSSAATPPPASSAACSTTSASSTGWTPWRSGDIDAEQFVELNERIGGLRRTSATSSRPARSPTGSALGAPTATTSSTAAGSGWPGPRSSTTASTSTTSRPASPTSTPPSGATSCGSG